MDLAEMLTGMDAVKMDGGERILVKEILDEAQDFVRRYHEAETFVPGDLVVWKPGMQNKKDPDYGEPIVVLETLDVVRREDNGTQYGGEPCDMRCIVEKHRGDLQPYAFDSHRFTKYTG
jgi:hypothetical protein